eukprot:CAMPEP_0170566640 /NCGR_PEP_ID=MMETSP0211-20121228/79973_1 /TAXON_ID=311385 /ORGANISM="Pseudokeronopsis sp., Strain OXSARD2" /LENGTH=78 /DNA_ID=CAMNT_0010887877 /DNA_START=594 /DNA_END=830 /DNA_ORIENTATION=+
MSKKFLTKSTKMGLDNRLLKGIFLKKERNNQKIKESRQTMIEETKNFFLKKNLVTPMSEKDDSMSIYFDEGTHRNDKS